MGIVSFERSDNFMIEHPEQRIDLLNDKISLHVLPVMKEINRKVLILNTVILVNTLLLVILMSVLITCIVYKGKVI